LDNCNASGIEYLDRCGDINPLALFDSGMLTLFAQTGILCRGRCSIRQSLPQYLTSLQVRHAFNFMSSFSSLPQLAQASAISAHRLRSPLLGICCDYGATRQHFPPHFFCLLHPSRWPGADLLLRRVEYERRAISHRHLSGS
jgi:hypothetical protein